MPHINRIQHRIDDIDGPMDEAILALKHRQDRSATADSLKRERLCPLFGDADSLQCSRRFDGVDCSTARCARPRQLPAILSNRWLRPHTLLLSNNKTPMKGPYYC